MAETRKTLNTRIALKCDTLNNWSTSTLKLEKGEIAIATSMVEEGGKQKPVTIIRIGEDGQKTFAQLPDALYSKASDVYEWAKAAEKPSYSADEITGLPKFITDKLVNYVDLSSSQTITGEKIFDEDKLIASNGMLVMSGPDTGTRYGASDIQNTKGVVMTFPKRGGRIAAIEKDDPEIPMPDGEKIIVGAPNWDATGTEYRATGVNIHLLNSWYTKLKITGFEYDQQISLDAPATIKDLSFPQELNRFQQDTSYQGEGTKYQAHIATEKFVQDAVAASISGAVQYWGLATEFSDLGKDTNQTGTPRINLTKGDFYRADSDKININGVYTRPGDLILAANNVLSSATPQAEDFSILRQESSEGTVTKVMAGSKLVTSTEGGIVGEGTISHETIAKPTSQGTTDSNAYIGELIGDGYGHITGYKTKSIKTLDTTSATALSTNSNESLTGSGKLQLHKIAKTGAYGDLSGLPSLTPMDFGAGETVQVISQVNGALNVTSQKIAITTDQVSNGTLELFLDCGGAQ